MDLKAALTDRIIPVLTFLLLSTPLTYVGTIFHEEGHGFLALAQGGSFSGIVIEQNAAYALANSYLVSIGGWAGQYVLLAIVLLLSWRLKPRSFLARSAVAIIVLHETFDQPRYIASLQGDSAGTLQILEASGVGPGASAEILQSVAVVLLVIGVYVSWRVFRSYFSQTFPWMQERRSNTASFLFVVLVAVSIFATLAPVEGPVLGSNGFIQALIAAGFLFLLSLVAIPPAPRSWQRPPDWSAPYAAFAFAFLLFVEAELVTYYVLPVTIPFP